MYHTPFVSKKTDKFTPAQSIHNVVQTPYGRLGALNCWEHIQACCTPVRLVMLLIPYPQPALKAHFYSQLPQLFVGGWWPAFPPGTGDCPFIVTGEASARMTQMVSMEGGCFGLTACQVVSEEGSHIMKMAGFPWFKFPGGGFSVVRTPLSYPFSPFCAAAVDRVWMLDLWARWVRAHGAHRPRGGEGRHSRNFARSDRQGQTCRGYHGQLVCQNW